jgi:hypothetical protein
LYCFARAERLSAGENTRFYVYHVMAMAMAMGRQWQWQWVGNGEAMTRGIAGNGIARYWQC